MKPFRSSTATALLLILVAGAITSCSDDDKKNPLDPGSGATSGFTGIFANGAGDGKVVVTINSAVLASRFTGHRAARASAHEITASAVLTRTGAAAVNLFGIYSEELDSLYVAGGGYTLIGHFDNSVTPNSITGSLAGPGGDGIFGCFYGSASTIKVYCGAYLSNSGPAAGTWTMATYDTALVGVAFPTGGAPGDMITFQGTVERTGTTRAIAFTGGDPGVLDLTGTGSLDTTTNDVSGDWVLDDVTDVNDDDGTWDGVLCP